MTQHAYLFPGQGSQFVGMGKDLYYTHQHAQSLFQQANQILGFDITEWMFAGSEEALQQTHIAQPAIFIHSTVLAAVTLDFNPAMVAGHSLGELSALVASGVLTFEAGLRLVMARSKAMQQACEEQPGAMAAVLGLSDEIVQTTCGHIPDLVIPANYNCPGQIVISGTTAGVAAACAHLQEAGAKKVVPLKVAGGFHSPLMKTAQAQLKAAIDQTTFQQGICPIYQNATGLPTDDPLQIQAQLLEQLISPVLWTQTIQHMIDDGASSFVECGPGKVLQGLVKKINPQVAIAGIA
jgi:[acyl-carrier-protein] S-malonyltransferase